MVTFTSGSGVRVGVGVGVGAGVADGTGVDVGMGVGVGVGVGVTVGIGGNSVGLGVGGGETDVGTVVEVGELATTEAVVEGGVVGSLVVHATNASVLIIRYMIGLSVKTRIRQVN